MTMGREDEEKVTSRWEKFRESTTVNKPLIPLKITMLLYYGGASLYLPYLTLQMVQVGLSIEEIAIIYSVLPFVTCVMPPIAGLIADKFNRYKTVLCASVASIVVFHILLVHTDARITPDEMLNNPTSIEANLMCSRTGATVVFENTTFPEMFHQNLSANLTVSDCSPVDCAGHQSSWIRMCLSTGNCTELTQHTSTVSFMLAGMDSSVEGAPRGSSFELLEVNVETSTIAGTVLCNCLTSCPITIALPEKALDEELLAAIEERKEAERIKHNRGFWMYFFMRVLASGSVSVAFSMLDATAIRMVKKYHGDLGKQRLFGVIGQSALAMFAGVLMDWTVKWKGYPDYSFMFYSAGALYVLVILLITRLDVDVEHVEAGHMAHGMQKLLRLLDVDFFMIMMLCLGSCWGFLESFLFVFLMELNASSYLLATTITLGCMVGIPFLYISDSIVRKIGSVNVFVITFLVYGVRFFGYSLIWDPWLCLFFEALEAVTIHMMAVASNLYCAAAAPPGLLATLNGAVGSVHYSFGRGVGSFAGGILMATFGTRATFRIFGTFAIICGAIYLITYRFFLVRVERRRLRRQSHQLPVEIVLPETKFQSDEGEEPTEDDYMLPPDNLMIRRLSAY